MAAVSPTALSPRPLRRPPPRPLHHPSNRRSSANFPTSYHPPTRCSSTYSILARQVLLMNKFALPVSEHAQSKSLSSGAPRSAQPLSAPPKSVQQLKDRATQYGQVKPPPLPLAPPDTNGLGIAKNGVGHALSDTPLPSHPGSPREYVDSSPPQQRASLICV